MITLAEVKESLRTFIAETSLYPPEKVKYETLIFEEGIFDSLGFLALINFIEERFKIKASDAELLESNFESIDAMAGFINSKLN